MTPGHLIAKAVQRGKRGWNVGARLECDPHFRRPHVALRWTGEGRQVPRIVPIRGSVVHRQRVAQVPTGYMDDERCKLCSAPLATSDVELCPACEAATNAPSRERAPREGTRPLGIRTDAHRKMDTKTGG